jgi:hypothetical protein
VTDNLLRPFIAFIHRALKAMKTPGGPPPMGEKQNQPFQLSFNASLKIDFQGSRVTSDGGLILVRELDERLGFSQLIEEHLRDPRRGKNTQFPLANLLRQSVYSGPQLVFQEVGDGRCRCDRLETGQFQVFS